MLALRFVDLRSVELICAHLQTNPSALHSFIHSPKDYYTPVVINQKVGRRPREVFVVAPALRRIHRVLAVALSRRVRLLSKHVHGFRLRRGIRTNAREHVGAECVVTADIKAFFGNVTFSAVVDVFERLGAPSRSAILLARLTTYNGSIPQGGRASPAIANLAVRALDESLLRLAGRAKYTRYADDLTFSGRTEDCPTESQLRDVLVQHGFELRSGSYKRQARKSGQIVTGLSVIHAKPTITRSRRRRIERSLYFGALYGLTAHVERTRSERSPQQEHGWLEGQVNAAGAVDKRLYRRWHKLFEKVKL
jgi:RNA-directed DNA polymerase